MTVTLVAVLGLCAVGHLIVGCAELLRASLPRPEVFDNPLFPSVRTEASALASQRDASEARITIGFGIALALLGAIVWRCRRKLIPTANSVDAKSTSLNKWFRRCALYGMAAACLGVFALPEVNGWILISRATTLTISQSFVLVGLSASVFAIAIGRDVPIRIADGFVPYTLAGFGALLSGSALVWMLSNFIDWLRWELLQVFC